MVGIVEVLELLDLFIDPLLYGRMGSADHYQGERVFKRLANAVTQFSGSG
jgi:hypothetical protein